MNTIIPLSLKSGLLTVLLLVFGSAAAYGNPNRVEQLQDSTVNQDDSSHQKDILAERIMLRGLYKRIVFAGDIEAYNELIDWYMDRYFYDPELFFYHLIMANQYEYPPAYYNAFWHLLNDYEEFGLKYEDIDPETKEMMLDLLNRGMEKGSEQCQSTLDRIRLTGSPY